MLPLRGLLPDPTSKLQHYVPRWGLVDALFQRGVQWDRGMGAEFGAQRCDPVSVSEFLREDAFEEERKKGRGVWCDQDGGDRRGQR